LYAELEINALNTTWDLLLVRPYRDGGPAVNGWEMSGLRTAVKIDGTLNNPSDLDRGWSVEIAIPWQDLRDIAGTPCPPEIGDQWRINFSRVQWEHEVIDGQYRKVAGKPEDNWVWSPQPAVDMHRPEAWGIVQFAETASDPAVEYPGWAAREELMRVYYAQQVYREAHGRYATAMELPITSRAALEATSRQFSCILDGFMVDEMSRLTRTSEAVR
jgi:hypothetical protein